MWESPVWHNIFANLGLKESETFLSKVRSTKWNTYNRTRNLVSAHRYHFRRQKHVHYYILIFTNPSAWAGYDTRSIFKRSLTGLNSEFSFSKTSCLSKAEEPNLPYYWPIAGGRIIGFILLPRVLVLCEMQSVSSRICTCVAMSISYDDNHYTTGTFEPFYTYIILVFNKSY